MIPPPFSLSLCIPTLNRYDCLETLLLSLHPARKARQTLPTRVVVLDNGQQLLRALRAVRMSAVSVVLHTPTVPLGLAESWNWFLRHIPGEHLICNDDVTFSAESFTQITDTPGAFVSPLAGTSAAFSCFLIRDEAIQHVGLFDEAISPGYAYFEDNDYAHRLWLAGIPITSVEAGVAHVGSATIKAFTPEQMAAHHQKFEASRNNFFTKWGFLPGDPNDPAHRSR